MNAFKMNVIDWAALTLVVIGALNWGLVGVAYFVDSAANWNIVNILFDSIPELEFAIYILVGLASLWMVYLATRLAGVRTDDMSPDTSGPTTR